jgi:hypothetical protein
MFLSTNYTNLHKLKQAKQTSPARLLFPTVRQYISYSSLPVTNLPALKSAKHLLISFISLNDNNDTVIDF